MLFLLLLLLAQWIHVSHYAMGGEVPVAVRQRPQKVGNLFGCEDEAEMCEHWASSGELAAKDRGRCGWSSPGLKEVGRWRPSFRLRHGSLAAF